MLKFLGTPGSPFVRKVRMALSEKNIPVEWVETSTSAPSPTALWAANPLGKIPVLVTEDGRAVYDSRVIEEYLEVLHPEPALLPPPGLERVWVRRWQALADGICDATVLISYEGRREIEAQRSPEWIAKQRGKVERGLAVVAADLGDREYCHGTRITLADIAVMTTLAYVERRVPAVKWRDMPSLARYFDRHSKRKSFIETVPPAA